MMDAVTHINPVFWAVLILSSATLFTFFWSLDAITHKKIAETDISDQELQTHRNILISSLLMEVSLVLMFWFQIEMLPLFIAFFLTRLVHEFIDELKYHSNRCTPYESYLHLGMWVSVLAKTAGMFIWGFFTGYEGLLRLPIIFYVWGGIILVVMGYVSWAEWRR